MRKNRLTTKEAADILGFSASTLRQWRKGKKVWEPGLGPKFYTIHGRAFYTLDSLDDWEFLCGSGQRLCATAADNERGLGSSCDSKRQPFSKKS